VVRPRLPFGVSRRELQARLEQQRAVADLGQLALGHASLQTLTREATRVVACGLDTEFAGLLELVPDRRALVVRSVVGWPDDWCDTEIVPADVSSQSGYTLAIGRPVIMDDIASETRFSISPQMSRQDLASGISTTIGSNGGSYGVLSAHTRSRRVFTHHDVAFLEAVAHVLAMSVRRRLAEEEVEKTNRVLGAVIEGTTDAVFVKDLEGRFVALNGPAARADAGDGRERPARPRARRRPDLRGDRPARVRDPCLPDDERPVPGARRKRPRHVRDRARHHPSQAG
jgi:PAS domain-containing protein